MSLRTRLLIAFGAVVAIPLALLALGLRQEMTSRLSAEYEQRLAAVIDVIEEDLQLESAGIGERLASLTRALINDDTFRAAVDGDDLERTYLLEYAGTAMRLTGLSMLQIQDGDGRIVSSGHFRNEHGRVEPGLAEALAAAPDGVALVSARSASGAFLALARASVFQIGRRSFAVVGGVVVDEALLGRLARDRAIVVSLIAPEGTLSAGSTGGGEATPATAAVREIRIPLVRSVAGAPADTLEARLVVTQSRAPLQTLLRSVDSWFLGVATLTGLTALVLAVWVSSRISRPLVALAEKTAVLDLDRLDVEFDAGTDEVGHLSRLLGDLAARLRSSTGRVREAERRATLGDLARQVNHDIKNGLIPLRNVMRHLTQVGRDDPATLAAVLAERRETVDSSIAYLETLATHYERLSQPAERRACDLNALVEEVIRGTREHDHVAIDTRLAPNVPHVVGDPVAIRRILENLTANAVDSLQSKPGRITISTEVLRPEGEPAAIRLTVADTGAGMTPEETSRIFTDFYTTKAGGTGLGLSIVRRLVTDLHGTLRVESEPGRGTQMIVEIPT